MGNHHDIQSSLARVEALVRETEELADPAARARVEEIVQGLLEYYGAGLGRMLELIALHGGPKLMDAFLGDELVASLLLLHDLHPMDVSGRVEQALDDVRPFLQSHGGDVELIGLTQGVVRLRLHGSCHGCPSSAVTMKTRIEQAIFDAAPDIDRVEVEEAEHGAISGGAGFVPLAALTGVNGAR